MFLISVLALLMCLTTRSLSSENESYLAPLLGMDIYNKHPDEYLILFHDEHTLEQHFHFIGQNLSSSPHFRRYTFGYQATMDDKTRDEQVRRDPGVELVETNRPVHSIELDEVVMMDDPPEFPHNRTSRLSKRSYHTSVQRDAPYGLQMLTTGSKKLKIPVLDEGTYEFASGAGRGVQVYVMDSGMRITHTLFGGRARNFGGLRSDQKSPYINVNMDDVTSHGTAVAGIIGANHYGVAPEVDLINVKVLDDLGTLRDHGPVGQAITDITSEHKVNVANAKNHSFWYFRGSVINMSFSWVNDGGSISRQLQVAHAAGISVFAAAGNQNEGYGDRYPCADPNVKCVGAVDNAYHKYKASNYGSTISFVAPGKLIQSLHCRDDRATAWSSGTSMASPHAAGAAAIFASWNGLETKRDRSENFVYWNSISGMVTGFPSGTTTLLINTGIHSPHKYKNEPFRFAGDNPSKPQAIDDPNSSVVDAWVQSAPPPLPSDASMTTVFTDMATETLAVVSGLETLPSILYDPDLTDAGSTASTSLSPDATSTSISSSKPTAVLSCASSGTPFAQPAVETLISSSFCGQTFFEPLFVPYIGLGNGTSQFGGPKSLVASGHLPLNDGTTNVVWFRLRFALGGCEGSFDGQYKCVERFSTVLNGCQTDTTTAKLGGTLVESCAEYDLLVVDEDTDPYAGDWADSEYGPSVMGEFTCEDVQSDLADVYPNTCSCWMAERPEPRAIFVKPASGVCNGKDVDQKNGLAPAQGY